MTGSQARTPRVTFGAFATEFGPASGLICGENSNPLAIFALIAEGTRIYVMSWPITSRLAEIRCGIGLPSIRKPSLAVRQGGARTRLHGLLKESLTIRNIEFDLFAFEALEQFVLVAVACQCSNTNHLAIIDVAFLGRVVFQVPLWVISGQTFAGQKRAFARFSLIADIASYTAG